MRGVLMPGDVTGVGGAIFDDETRAPAREIRPEQILHHIHDTRVMHHVPNPRHQ